MLSETKGVWGTACICGLDTEPIAGQTVDTNNRPLPRDVLKEWEQNSRYSKELRIWESEK